MALPSKSRKRRPTKGITAWLVTWDGVGEENAKQNIATILNPHWSARRVRELVEIIYVNSAYSLSERIGYAKNRSFNPYPAQFSGFNGIRWEGQIICGDNPWLFARIVDNLTVDPDNEQKTTWSERPIPDFEEVARRLGITKNVEG
jgi:hypothetical protein